MHYKVQSKWPRGIAAGWLRCGGVSVLVVFFVLPLFAEDWPQWRGPNRNGISAEKGWLDHWPVEGPPIAWKAAVGTGFSSFAVAGGRVYTTGNSDNTDTIFVSRPGQAKNFGGTVIRRIWATNILKAAPRARPPWTAGGCLPSAAGAMFSVWRLRRAKWFGRLMSTRKRVCAFPVGDFFRVAWHRA